MYTLHFTLYILQSTFYSQHFTLHTVPHQPYDLNVDSPEVTLPVGRSHNLKVPEGPDPQS